MYFLNRKYVYLMPKNRIMHRNKKKKYAIVKVCFQSHVNMKKCYLPCDVLLNCCILKT